ncbi:MAG TPA: OmpA family protein [Phycisphaerae bacterium]|nr:OmpA family protein [Phycisphaerae bacterium]HRY68593.1 OmpA family protein [Phycisphaerae bacterium]HSA25642.1 OmpA family protein [Phycisphaerae bacterium]
MRSYWVWGVSAILLAMGNVGCYYDQWQASERDNRVLREDLGRAKQDLADAEQMLKQKDTTIASLNSQLSAKDQIIANLSAERDMLKNAFGKAQGLLDKNLASVPGVIINAQVLPKPLHEAIKRLAQEHPDILEYDEAKGAVRFKADLIFPLGSDELGSGVPVDVLKKFADIVREKATGFDVIVVGHTCTTPIGKPETRAKHPTNWHLSAHRAIAVMSLLAGQGIEMTRMGVMGYGEYRPIADNGTADGKAKNRRVEIFLVSKEKVQSMSRNVSAVKHLGLAFLRADAGGRHGS